MRREKDGVVRPPKGISAAGDDAHFLRTVRSAWQSNAPDQSELDRAWRRYQLRPRGSRTFPRGAMVGVAVGVMSSLATAAVVVNWSRVSEAESPTPPAQPAATQKPVVRARPNLQRPPELSLPLGAASSPEAPSSRSPGLGLAPTPKSFDAPAAEPTVGSVPGASRQGSARPSSLPGAPSAVPGSPSGAGQASALPGAAPAAAVSKPSASGATRTASPAAARFPSTSAWERANAALERDDRVEAERALGELAASSDAATRDAATLARAQLWVSSGEFERARPVLERLSRSGSTALVRERAAALLQRIP